MLQFRRFTRFCGFSCKTSSVQFLLRLPNQCQCKKHFGRSFAKLKKDDIPSVSSKYELFSEETAPVILDVEEERQRVVHDEKIFDEFEGINLESGADGVFDVKEIVELLKRERGEDIFVLQIPPEYNYADYMVIVNGRSTKHMEAMADFVRRVYKRKIEGSSSIPKLEGKNSNTWKALDLGNIILHVFSREARKVYDLETLWSVGKDFDTFSKKQSTPSNSLNDYSKILAALTPNT